MTELAASGVWPIALTLLVYYVANRIYGRWRHALLNDVLLAIVAIIVLLRATGIDYDAYNRGGRIISFFLGPAVVALGALLYERLAEIRARGRAIIVATVAGSVTGIVSAAGIAALLGASRAVVLTIAPKSVTTPIAMGIAEKLGGIAPLAAALVIATGVLGAVAGPWFLRRIGVRSATAFGMAMGMASHGIGTARAVREGDLEGATSGLAISLNGIATAVLTPILLALIELWVGF